MYGPTGKPHYSYYETPPIPKRSVLHWWRDASKVDRKAAVWTGIILKLIALFAWACVLTHGVLISIVAAIAAVTCIGIMLVLVIVSIFSMVKAHLESK